MDEFMVELCRDAAPAQMIILGEWYCGNDNCPLDGAAHTVRAVAQSNLEVNAFLNLHGVDQMVQDPAENGGHGIFASKSGSLLSVFQAIPATATFLPKLIHDQFGGGHQPF